MTNQAKQLQQGTARSRPVLMKSLVAAFLMTGTISMTSAYALDLNANVGVGSLVDANVSLSLDHDDGLDADVDVDLGSGNTSGGGVNVAVGVGGGSGSGLGVNVGVGGGTGTGGGNGTGGGVVVPVNVNPGDTPIVPGTRNSREGVGAGAGVRCVAGGNVDAMIGTEVVDKQGVLLGWVEGATMEGRKLGKIWYKTTDSGCRSLQGGMSMAGDQVRVNATAAEIG